MKAPDTFSAIVNLWPSAPAMAADIGQGVTAGQVRVWRHRDVIPAQFWSAIVLKAKERGYRGVTPDLLTSLASNKAA